MVLFVLTYAIAEAFLLPAAPATLLAGRFYGLVLGSALVVLGASLGAIAVFVMTRRWLRPQASHWLERSRHLEALQLVVSQEGLRVMVLARLSPVLPFNLLNVAYGLSDIRPLTFAVGLVGIVPGAVLYVGLGTAVSGSDVTGFQMVGLLATLACALLLARRLLPALRSPQPPGQP
ncbi:VTT domain-containing protein [Cyanobium gracile UHCC 0139]|uniref:TVP38/TMEM64 family membrane protein n=1 Tax=Cyanobium gracile UHCC 0139 TaxID=3110308 RepID=A0ABU5RQI7_9CYAN|nr:VTT domain-containing protein [Cyanobium gracile]MEA5390035.1 VTT domain-containing protein [Cyanobium gracile UHCC 0139]